MSSYYCLRCNRSLRNPASVKHGYGPVCWSKVRRTMRLEKDQAPDPVTIIDQVEAARTRRDLLYRLLHLAAKKTCDCGTPFGQCEFVTCDHSGGLPLKGYGERQWVWFECPKCGYQYAWWKLRPPALDDLLVSMPKQEIQNQICQCQDCGCGCDD